nr:peptide chain release factor 2 [Lyticum sinuosum]
MRDYLNWDKIQSKLEELSEKAAQIDIWEKDPQEATRIMKEKSHIEYNINEIKNAENTIDNLIELYKFAEDDPEIFLEIQNDMQNLMLDLSNREIECLFSGEADERNCFIEIHSGAGGTESDDWTSILMRMYYRWTERRRFKAEIVSQILGEEAGIKSVTIKIIGKNAYGWLKAETGVHRLVRISPFNSAGKRHTSFVSVWIYPLIDDKINIVINDSDIRVDTYRSSGAGGQHVNTTDSAVRITHIPTGIVVQSQNDRSQHRNKEECIVMLKSRLYELEIRKKEEAANNNSKTEIGWGHQIRSYVLHPYQMVKDLRTNHETSNTKAVLDGEIDEFLSASLLSKIQNIKQE